ncbi:MAG: hypothetical protein PUC39_10980 [Lachnospiraceae bacterium]|nr:hypothetical protein [Lachnospiraceae bacterium]
MGDFSTELEILQDENFAIKAPKGFKGEAWKSKSGRPGRVLYSRYSPDYITSDCYITVSTIAKNPITAEIRRRIEKHIGKDGFSFEFRNDSDRHIVLYAHEEEVDYKTYHAIILLNEKKAVMVDVVFNSGYDNSKEVAETIITSIHTNFKEEVTEEELAIDAARLEAEDQAEAAKEAAKKAQMQAEQSRQVAASAEPPIEIAEMVEESKTVQQEEESSNAEVPEQEIEAAEDAELVEEIADSPEVQEPVEPEFDDSEEGKQMKVIYDTVKQHSRMTLSELQTVPQLLDVGRMGITKLLNVMIRDEILLRLEEADNIYFAVPGQEQSAADEAAASAEPVSGGDLDPMEQYKIDMEKYKEAMAQWKKSKDFFGRTDMPKPVEPVKPKKKK